MLTGFLFANSKLSPLAGKNPERTECKYIIHFGNLVQNSP